MAAELLANARKSQFDRGIGGKICLEDREAGVTAGEIETDDAVVVVERGRQGPTEIPCRAGYQNNRSLVRHHALNL
jgi:hypothetical protein